MNVLKLSTPHRTAAIALAACLASGTALAQTATPSTPSTGSTASTTGAATVDRGDRQFVEKAAQGGMMEVQLGQAAQQKASNAQVKSFGERMAQDHGKANDELKKIAGAKGLTVPTAMERSHMRDMERLQKLSGAEFDREYMKHMVADHKKDISAFEKQAKSGKDAELKAFAAKTLPTLQAHLKLAQTTHDAVKNAK